MKEIVNKFIELLKESTITQSLLVVAVFGTIAYCVIVQVPVPEQLSTWGSVIVGFFFGSKAAYQLMKGK